MKKAKLANQIHVVRDGAEAIEYIFREGAYAGRPNGHPKLILLDLKLPKVDGIEVLRRIKGSTDTHKIPVVVLTTSREDRDIEACYDLGVNSYIAKPVDFEQFVEAARTLGMYWLLLNQAPLE